MGFPSPAMDYQEQRLTIDLLCGIDGNSRVIETNYGWAVINVAIRPEQGDTLLVRMDNRNEFAKLYGEALITEDGEAIEGEALDDVEVFGVLTHSLNRVGNADCVPI
jgi:DNA polymerase V